MAELGLDGLKSFSIIAKKLFCVSNVGFVFEIEDFAMAT